MKKIDNWILKEYEYPLAHLGIFRIVFMLYLLFLGMPSYAWITENPDFFYNPPVFSLSILFDSFPPKLFFYILNITIYTCVIFMLFGYYTKKASIFFSLIQIIASHFAFSFGKIDHSILFIITPLLLGLAGWGNSYSIDAQNSKREVVSAKSYYISLLVLIIGFAYFSSGYFKFRNSWIDFDLETHATRTWAIMTHYREERGALLGSFFVHIENAFFWELLDYITVMMELLLLPSIFKKRLFHVALFILIIFHVLVYLMVGIPFFTHFAVFALFFPWQKLNIYNKLDNFTRVFFNKKNLVILGLFVIPSYFTASLYLSLPASFYCVNPFGLFVEYILHWDYYALIQYISIIITFFLLFLLIMKKLKNN